MYYITFIINVFRPEAIGVVSGCVFLITVFLFIPIPFSKNILNIESFPHHEVRINVLNLDRSNLDIG